jgi:hypothetical protein
MNIGLACEGGRGLCLSLSYSVYISVGISPLSYMEGWKSGKSSWTCGIIANICNGITLF